MVFKNNFKFLAAALMLLGTSALAQGQKQIREDFVPPMTQKMMGMKAPATAPTVTHDYDWYAAKTYTWTDASGVSHTASLVDEATDPYQIFDLLKWVYCNPEIPGNKYTAVTGSNVYYGEQYLIERTGSWWSGYDYEHVDVGWGITNNNVTAPYEDGHTLFLVKLKNYNDEPDEYTYSKSDIISYFNKYIESVQLIANGLRAGEGDNAGTIVNISGTLNRFFILGKGKSFYWEPKYNSNTPPLAPFYNMFEEYSPTTTDVGDQITDFYQKMNNGETYSVLHDCGSVIFFEHYFSMAGKNNTEEKSLSGMIFFIPDNRNAFDERNYDVNHQPTVGMYVIQLDANAAPAAQEKTYDVTLDWTSSLNSIVDSEIPQTYTVYIVLTDEMGNQTYELLTTTTETTYTYQVPQNEHSYTISYIVHGVATADDTFEAWSNIDDVVIPGWNDFLVLTLNHYESDFKVAQELNYYRNFLKVGNEDVLNALTPARINAGEDEFVLYRFDNNNPEVMIPVAELTLNASGNGVTYTVAYDNQDILNGYQLNQINIATSGNLGNYAANAAIDLSKITFCDQFSASTEDNTHPSRYGYILAAKDNSKSTNTVEVPVVKTSADIDGFYTLEEVMSDVDRHLTTGVKNANVELNLVNNPAIYYYTLDRGDENKIYDQISKLQRRTDGTFMEMNNALNLAGNIYEEGTLNLYDFDIITGSYGDFAAYSPVIWTFGTDRVKNDGENSYGSPIMKTGVAKIDANSEGSTYTQGQYVTWFDENRQICCIFNPIINVEATLPEYASVDYDVFMYRVWRLCDGVRGFVYDPVTGFNNNDPTAPREADKLIVEELTNETNVVFGDPKDDVLHGGISYGALLSSKDKTKFLVRMYYVKKEGAKAELPLYYVVEREVSFDPAVGVNEISADNAVSKTYYNAQGVASSKPFDGINIVVTRYSDGSTKTTKVVK